MTKRRFYNPDYPKEAEIYAYTKTLEVHDGYIDIETEIDVYVLEHLRKIGFTEVTQEIIEEQQPIQRRSKPIKHYKPRKQKSNG